MYGKTFKNSLSIIGGDALNKGVGIALLLCLTAYLAPDDFGRLSFVVAYVAFFGVFTDLGVNTLVTRQISAGLVDPSVGFGNAIAVRLAAAFLAAAALLVSLLVMGYPSGTLRLAAAASLSLFFSAKGLFLRRVFDIPFQAGLRMHVPAFVNLSSELAVLGAALWLMYEGAGLTALLLGMALANLPAFVLAAYLSTRLLCPRFKLDISAWAGLLRSSLPLGAAALLEGSFVLLPLLVLSFFSTDEALGYYSLPFRLAVSLWIVPVAVMISLLPGMSREAFVSAKALNHASVKGLKLALALSLPIALALTSFSGVVVSALAKAAYAPAGPVLSVMGWGTAAYFVNTVFFYTFVAAGRQAMNTVVWLGVSALSLVLCLALVPAYGHIGAAWAYTAPLVAGAALNLWFASRILGLNALPVLVRFCACALPAAALLMTEPFSAPINAALAALVYLALMPVNMAHPGKGRAGWATRSMEK